MSEIRFEPVDKEVVIAVAEAEDLAQQVWVNRVSRRAAKQRTLEQNEKSPDVVLWIQPAIIILLLNHVSAAGRID
jgi:hypothetical protein